VKEELRRFRHLTVVLGVYTYPTNRNLRSKEYIWFLGVCLAKRILRYAEIDRDELLSAQYAGFLPNKRQIASAVRYCNIAARMMRVGNGFCVSSN
jgi:hypothetical protein